MIETLEGQPLGAGRRIGIAVAKFHELVTERLLDGALTTLQRCGVAAGSIHVVRVPGAFELPHACGLLFQHRDVDAALALGAVIRGETPHFDYVCAQAAVGVQRLCERTGRPTLFGVLTTENLDQALSRAGAKVGNKGEDAALAALQMLDLATQLTDPAQPQP